MAAPSPGSSPRLPSPPPIAEDQIGPTSPGLSLYEDPRSSSPSTALHNAASRRIRPGTKAEDMSDGPPLVDLASIDSAFQLTEHLKALHHSHTHPPDSLTTHPITAEIAKQLAIPPPNTSKEIWLYELARFLTQKTNAVIVGLFHDDPPCSPTTCPEMRASEWQYLCAVHEPPKSCAAIDYCCHTLDWAANTLTSSKMFPSRLGLGSGSGALGNDKVLAVQMKEIKNIFRRVYRIYAHAWFQHREMFWRVEGKTGLYVFFKTVCDEYGIIEGENYTIPAEAEGVEPEVDEQGRGEVQTPSVLRREVDKRIEAVAELKRTAEDEEMVPLGVPGMDRVFAGMGDTTKRHRHTKSDFSRDPSTVIKEEVEDEDGVLGGGLASIGLARQSEPSLASPVADKPSLDRQMTALKDMVEPTEMEADTPISTQPQEGEAVWESEIGISRSDTVKPEKQEESSDEVEVEVKEVEAEAEAEEEGKTEDEGEQTVIETVADDDDPDAASKADSEEFMKNMKSEATESDEQEETETKMPQDQAAAEADDADKSVGD
ncbi:hypothetical protein LTR09_008805 [Extremus antarcticus]|uniref:Mob1/phocein n=1 Tax=Extremus antarcticus TaxID=702011 RepID=A0AAJ0G6K5_9PEZI|nr:hypothetical protein LTR09_008805 [Extremus antarcticus]